MTATKRVSIALPEEFLELCQQDRVRPERVLRAFIADLCGLVSYAAAPREDGYCTSGSDERDLAQAYYDRCGYKFMREMDAEGDAEMKRQHLDAGGWFNLETAKSWRETTHWDGSNHISNATGSQWDHEALYRTRSGGWVLNHWPQRQGSGESWILIEPQDAAAWLIRCGLDLPPDLATVAAEMEV